MLLLTRDGKNIGMYDKDRNVFFKHGVKESKHLYKTSDAWGIDGLTFQNVLQPGCRIVIEETEKRIRYETTKETALQFGHFLHFKEHGLQFFIPREYFKKSNLF